MCVYVSLLFFVTVLQSSARPSKSFLIMRLRLSTNKVHSRNLIISLPQNCIHLHIYTTIKKNRCVYITAGDSIIQSSDFPNIRGGAPFRPSFSLHKLPALPTAFRQYRNRRVQSRRVLLSSYLIERDERREFRFVLYT